MPIDPPTPETPADGAARIVPTVVLLSFIAGSMDAIAFIALGQVFTSAMSGNTVLLGIAAAQGNLHAALRELVAIGGYVAGVLLASLPLGHSPQGHGKLVLETLFLLAFSGLWFAMGGPAYPWLGYALIGFSSIAMGVQGAIGRMIGIPSLLTVVFTSTWTAIVGSATERMAARHRPVLTRKARRQLLALAAYFGGALLGGFITLHWLWLAPVVPLACICGLAVGLLLRLCCLGAVRPGGDGRAA